MTRPRIRTEGTLLPGLAAVALFGVLALTFLGAPLAPPAGFGEGAAVMKSLGAALMGFEPSAVVGDATPVPGESMLAAFEIVDLVLVAALVAAVMLARRDEGGQVVTLAVEAVTPDAEDDGDPVAADGGDPAEDVRGGEDA